MSPPWWWHGSRYDYYNYYYGYGNRRADAAEASLSAERKNREAENQMRERMQNKVDEQRAAQDKILQQQIRQAQETSAESIRNLERDRKEIIAKFESSAAATAKANSAEKAEIMNAHNNTIRETRDKMPPSRHRCRCKDWQYRGEEEEEDDDENDHLDYYSECDFDEAADDLKEAKNQIQFMERTLKDKDATIERNEKERREMIARFESSTAATAKGTENTELINYYIKEKDAVIDQDRMDHFHEMENLRMENEETIAMYEAKFAALQMERMEDMKAAGEKILALENEKTKIAMQGMMSHERTIANSFLILQNVSFKNALQGDSNNLKTKIEAMRSAINRMEMHRGQLLDWVFLDSLKEDLNNLKGIFNVCISDMSANSSFASDRIEAAKKIFNAAITMIRAFFDEIAQVRLAASQEILATLANNSIGFRAPPTPTEEFDPVLHL
ncbi:hypothetical protein PRIPAC_87357 [Pristionchus pacificus]|uniref:Uncharacterized protein n=1 Tax=Pristionchus pacificus TaxID=54126 RepID=A0A2A6B7N4_PRIPA|nr:hypothetical protein PRIPAC_87357 [Pristionchus pacificus]|eukprot:PDM61892.1 hypothetical protein PRIPAC_51334 [Pristionchus pacificus]